MVDDRSGRLRNPHRPPRVPRLFTAYGRHEARCAWCAICFVRRARRQAAGRARDLLGAGGAGRGFHRHPPRDARRTVGLCSIPPPPPGTRRQRGSRSCRGDALARAHAVQRRPAGARVRGDDDACPVARGRGFRSFLWFVLGICLPAVLPAAAS